METFWFNMGMQVMLVVIKNPDKRKKMRDKFLTLFRAIKLGYADDPDFTC